MTSSLWKHNNLFKIFETWLLKLKNEFVGKLLCLNTWIFCSSLLHSTIWNCFLWRKIVLSFPKRMCIIRFLRLKSHLVVRISCAAEAHHTSHFPTSTDSLLSFWVPALCGNLKCWNHFVCGREDLRESNQLTLSCSVFFLYACYSTDKYSLPQRMKTLQSTDTHNGVWGHKKNIMEKCTWASAACVCVEQAQIKTMPFCHSGENHVVDWCPHCWKHNHFAAACSYHPSYSVGHVVLWVY